MGIRSVVSDSSRSRISRVVVLGDRGVEPLPLGDGLVAQRPQGSVTEAPLQVLEQRQRGRGVREVAM